MSATNRGAIRREADFYPTPEGCVYSLLNELDLPDRFIWGEPCVGNWDIPKAVTNIKSLHTWVYAEIQEGRDYLVDGMNGQADGIMTNPPFSLAQEFIDRSLQEVSFAAYLLRINFLGSKDRKAWWQGKEPTHLYVLSERPAFVSICKGGTKDGEKIKSCGKVYELHTKGKCDCGGNISKGTDATEYAWFVWDKSGICNRDPGVYVI